MEGDATFSPRGLTSGDFNPRPPWGGRLPLALFLWLALLFQSTPSVGRATANFLNSEIIEKISIHALRGEGDFCIFLIGRKLSGFQSTPSVGRATSKPNKEETNSQFQSTPSVGRATDNPSITFPVSNISIHALRGEGDQSLTTWSFVPRTFQSTPSVGRATLRPLYYKFFDSYFNPRPPWGGRLLLLLLLAI